MALTGLLIFLVLVIGSFVLGNFLAWRWRLPEYGWKLGVIFSVVSVATLVCVQGWPPKLGVDLSGGVILVYEVDQQQKQQLGGISAQQMDEVVRAVSRRVNPGGQKEIVIRKYGAEQVEIIIPHVEAREAERIKDIVSRAGTLEFRILANNRDHKDIQEAAEALPKTQNELYDNERNLIAWWVPIYEGQPRTEAERRAEQQRISGLLNNPEISKRQVTQRGREVWQILVVKDEWDVTGAYLAGARASRDEKFQPCVSFRFNDEGARRFGELTLANRPDPGQRFRRKLGIILDGKLYSAPEIRSPIYAEGQITGSFTPEEVKSLVDVLNAGSLPMALAKEPVMEMRSDPLLGADTIAKSINAMILSSILVPLFMVWYYRFSGVVANVALAINILCLVAIMIMIQAPFTLTGFAGLALTIGMAVDNNVLIYERLREELERGASLRMAIRNAFQRVTTVIVDANITTMLAATILWVVGSDQVRGFAVTLWIGVLMSIFTAVFVARVIFEITERRRWLKKAKMLKVIGATKFDFMRWFPHAAAASLVITLGGLAVAVARGQGLFDIDFTGGTSVQVVFNEPQDTGSIRRALQELPDVAVAGVRVGDEEPGLRFNINTSEKREVVEERLAGIFGDKLVRNRLRWEQPKAIGLTAPTPPANSQTKSPTELHGTLPVQFRAAEQTVAFGQLVKKPAVLLRPGAIAMRDAMIAAALLTATEQQSDAPAEEAKKPDEQAKKPSEQAQKPTEQAQKPAEQAHKPADAALPAEKPATKSAEAALPGDSKGAPPGEPPVKAPESKPAQAAEDEDPFVGGTAVQLSFQLAVTHQTVEALVKNALSRTGLGSESTLFQMTNPDWIEGQSTRHDRWDLKIKLPPEQVEKLLAAMKEDLESRPFFPATNTIGGAVAESTRQQAYAALVASWVTMIVYLWIRFQGLAFGVAAVVALIHDVLVILGAIAVSYYVAPVLGWLKVEQFKINLPIVAAFLTIIGYSVNDTIVIFDRLREVRGKDPRVTRAMINTAVNQTLSRTILTAFTVLLVAGVLYIFGGAEIHGFAFALILGTITGSYSSIYIAAPIVLYLTRQPKVPAVEPVRVAA